MIVSLPTLLSAQNLSFGPTVGIGHSWTSSKGSLDRRFHVAPSIGGKLVYSFISNWGLSADVRFSGEGQTIGEDKDNKIVARANYIRIPLQALYFFGKFGDEFRPKVSIGPSFGFLVGGQNKRYDDGDVINKTKTKNVAEGFDFGVMVAAGFNYRLAKSTWLNADLGYYNGLVNVPKNGDGKNRSIGINIGITLPVGTYLPPKPH